LDSLKNDADLFNNLFKLLLEKKITNIVIGLPLMQDGKETATSIKINQFIDSLTSEISQRSLSIKIYTIDESYSTNSAYEFFDYYETSKGRKKNEKFKKIKDSVSAKVILESFLRKIN